VTLPKTGPADEAATAIRRLTREIRVEPSNHSCLLPQKD
jgi:hypothetical protein